MAVGLGQRRTESPVVADQVGSFLDPGGSSFRHPDTYFPDFLRTPDRRQSYYPNNDK